MSALPRNRADQNVLTAVREGSPVYDRDRQRVGIVKHVQFSDGADTPPLNAPRFLTQFPDEIQARLLEDGFIQVDCGLMWPERCITPEQIASVTEDGLWLNVGSDELLVV